MTQDVASAAERGTLLMVSERACGIGTLRVFMHAMVTTELVQRLGGVTRLAEQLAVKRSRVNMWVVRDAVPPDHWLPLWALALERGVPWTPPGAERVVALLRAPTPQVDAINDFARAA